MRRRARSAASPPSGARRPREASGLSPPNAVVDPDPDPAADEEPPAASRRPHLELPRRGEHRAIDLRSVRIFVEPHAIRSEEHTSELQSLMRISYAVFCLKKKIKYHR